MQPSAGRHLKLISMSLYEVFFERVTNSMVDDTSVVLGLQDRELKTHNYGSKELH